MTARPPGSKPAGRPRTLPDRDGALAEERIAGIRRRIVQDADCARGWAAFDSRMRGWAERVFEWERRRPGAAEDRAVRLAFARSAAGRAAELAFHHRMNGDAASADAARRLALPAMEEADWSGDGGADPSSADITAAFALTFEHLGPALKPGERSAWAAALHGRGVAPLLADWIDPRTRRHSLDSSGHNAWAVCVGGAALALFCLRHQIPGWAARTRPLLDGFGEFFRYPGNPLQNKRPTFGAQGDFVEPVGYLDCVLHRFPLVCLLARDLLGRDLVAESPMLRLLPDYAMACVQPLRRSVQRLNFGDMGSGDQTVASSDHPPAPGWLWLAGEFGRDDLLHLVRETQGPPTRFLDFLFWPERAGTPGFAEAPGDVVLANAGVGVLRDGYGPDATVFAIRTGEMWNHNQSDAGSFILSSAGVEFVIDPGTTSHSDPTYHGYFLRSAAHNVVLHDGRGQDEALHRLGTRFPGSIPASLSAPGYRYLLADACGPWAGVYRRCYRHVLWIDRFLVLVDDLMAHGPGAWDSLLHHAGEAEVDGRRIHLRNGGETLTVHFASPRPEWVETRAGHASRVLPDDSKYAYAVDPLPYLAVRFADRGVREKIVQVLELPGADLHAVEPIEDAHVSGVRVRDAAGTWEIRCNHLADGRPDAGCGELRDGGLRTDAFLACLHRDARGELDRAALHHGSYLAVGGTVRYSALLKGNVVLGYGNGEVALDAALSAPAWAEVATPRAGGDLTRLRIPEGPFRTVLR